LVEIVFCDAITTSLAVAGVSPRGFQLKEEQHTREKGQSSWTRPQRDSSVPYSTLAYPGARELQFPMESQYVKI